MKVGKDSVGIALPFTAGIALSTCLIRFLNPPVAGVLAVTMLTFIGATSGLLTLPRGIFPGRLQDTLRVPWHRKAALSAILFATGSFVMLTRATSAGVASGLHQGPVSMLAESCSQSLKELIDGTGYSDTATTAIVKAILTGDRSGLDQATREAFRASGASHLLALSGMHLGIIYIIAVKLTAGLGHDRKASAIRSCTTIFLTGFFTLMTGAGPSVVRAFLFILINEAASITGRAKDSVHTLCIALVTQLAITPESISSAGFQLSYLAMAGIIVLYPVMKGWYPQDGGKGDIMRKIWNAAALSVSCQAFTAPAVWYHFGTFPQYFILTNLLAIPLTTLTMTTSIAVTALSAFGICPDIMVTANEAAVSALLFTLETISRM